MLTPIKFLVENTSGYSISDSVRKIINKLEAGMESWRNNLLSHPTWFNTVASKESAVADLEQKLIDYQNDFIRVSVKENQQINEKISIQEKLLDEINNKIGELVEETNRLADTLEKHCLNG